MRLIISTILLILIFSQIAFAGYGYKINRRGTGYWRDTSNDGIIQNNANYIGLNSPRVNGGRARIYRRYY